MDGMIFIGIDNGVTGTIGAIYPNGYELRKMPIREVQDYHRVPRMVSRIDHEKLEGTLKEMLMPYDHLKYPVRVAMERPFMMQYLTKAVASALRSFEATLCVLERLNLSHEFVDSRQWQKELLRGAEKKQLKKVARSVAQELFPLLNWGEGGWKDGEGLLIAEYLRRHR